MCRWRRCWVNSSGLLIFDIGMSETKCLQGDFMCRGRRCRDLICSLSVCRRLNVCRGCIIRLVTLNAIQCTENVVSQYDFTDYRGESDVILRFYPSILGDDIFLTLERIQNNQPCFTTLPDTVNSGSFQVPGQLSRSQSKLYSSRTDYIRRYRTVHQMNHLFQENLFAEPPIFNY